MENTRPRRVIKLRECLRTGLAPVDFLTLAYLLIVGTAISILGSHLAGQVRLIAIHFGLVLLIVVLVPRARASGVAFFRFLADWYPVPLYVWMYTTANLVNTIVFREPFDAFFRNLDAVLFGVQPSFWLAQTYGSPLLDDIIHGLYFSYYLLIPAVGAFFYFGRKDRVLFQRYLFAVCFTFYISYLVFIALPVHGPHLLRGDDDAGVFFVPIMDFIYAHAETGGGAFPSSHVSVALVCLLFARRYGRGLFFAALPSAVGLFVATVYCRYHYAVDSLAGIAWGTCCYCVANAIFTRLVRSKDLAPPKGRRAWPASAADGAHRAP